MRWEIGGMASATPRAPALGSQQRMNVANAAQPPTGDEAQVPLLNELPATVALLDTDGRVVAVGEGGGVLHAEGGSSLRIAVGTDYLALCTSLDTAALAGSGGTEPLLKGVLAGDYPFASFTYSLHSLDRQRWFRLYVAALATGDARGAVVMHIDVTANVEAEQRLFERAHFDELTMLPNRILFLDRLRQALRQARRYDKGLAVLLIDVDRFKHINDTFGYALGDEFLKQVARRLEGSLRESDAVGRLGEDTFGVLLPELHAPQEIDAVARRIVSALGLGCDLHGHTVSRTASVGIAVFPEDADDGEQLMHCADRAMHLAKDAGRSAWAFHTPVMNEQAVERVQLTADLREALVREELELQYQPRVDCRSRQIVGAAALLSWNHPEHGLIGAAEFVPMLEETELLNDVAQWLIRAVCRQIKGWQAAGLPPMAVAVSFSARQLAGTELLASVGEALVGGNLPAHCLQFQLSESALLSGVEQIVTTLAELRRLGVTISVGEAGSGYPSLVCLKRLPLDAVRFDRSLFGDISPDRDNASLTHAAIAMAHSLKLKAVAEGVETAAQLALLVANHCDEVQGDLLSPPLTADALAQLVKSGRNLIKHRAAGAGRQRTLLIVDDEENILMALKRVLRRDGYTIFTAGGGVEALEVLARNPVDVILSDQRMPTMTGVEFLRRARVAYPEAVRVVLSGYTELQSITDAINEGAIYKFLTKPWDDGLLRARIEEAFRHKELADENRRLSEEIKRVNGELTAANLQLRLMVEDKQRQLLREQASLDVAQEILQDVPIPVLGVDEDGLIVFANVAAEQLLPGPSALVASDAAERLPAELLALLVAPDDLQQEADIAGHRHQVACRRLRGRSRGRLLVVLD